MKVPATMATQHPDNARAPYWLGDGFVSATNEVEECYRCFKDIGCEEFLWDWEGKHADESVVEKLLENYGGFFRKKQLGRDITLTFRFPNIWQEREYRLAKAFVSILSANDFATEYGVHAPPINEAYLPMTTAARQVLFIEDRYREVANAFQALKPSGPREIKVTPLIETVHLMANADKIVAEYLAKRKADETRVWFARSDPALNSGCAAAVLGVKTGLARLRELEENTGARTHPIIGVGCLPFRGGLTPDSVREFAGEYPGIRTVTVQSGFRYDYPLKKVKHAIAALPGLLKKKAGPVDGEKAIEASRVFERFYTGTIEGVAGEVNRLAAFVPRRRERRLHIGLFGYSRNVGKKRLPRAIAFVAALYSVGVPPEFIGAGRALRELEKRNLVDAVEDVYTGLRKDLVRAGHFLNKENLEILATAKTAWKRVKEDVLLVEEFLGEGIGPVEEEHFIHRNIASNVRILLSRGGNVTEEITRAGEIRRSLG
ncbi:MAG: phosphoenolpyruvate carboxylase [Candidatus Micrarchaeota archaeon]|nr:phosphoenolpyruvate carboxylase [Candidatus Micrarchaeota archaeon]